MKHIKLFESFFAEITTLRDVINPDNYPDDDDDDRLRLAIELATRTCELLGLKLPPDQVRLKELGLLADPLEELNLMVAPDGTPALDSVIEVYNLLGRTHLNEPETRKFASQFPGILSYDEDTEEFRRPESSTVISEEYWTPDSHYDEVRVVLFRDEAGLLAVEWEDQYNLTYFMLKKDLANAA